MGLTAEQLERMTIAELVAAAEKVAAALEVLIEAGAWQRATLRRGHVVASAEEPPAAAPPVRVAPPVAPRPLFSSAELAEKTRLMRQFGAGPDEAGDGTEPEGAA